MNFLESVRRLLLDGDSKSIREMQAKSFARRMIGKNKKVFERLADM